MKKILSFIYGIFLYLWQLPQNIAGLVLYLIYHKDDCLMYRGVRIGVDSRFRGGVSLGNYMIIYICSNSIVCHEYGHYRQSRLLGWLYLPIIGVCSGVHNIVHSYKIKNSIPCRSYYDFWTERWADKLGRVHRAKTRI